MSGIGRTRSITLAGLRGEVVHVEADIAQSLPGFTLLGLPDQALQESRDRIRSAARNAGLPLTRRHLTVNLLPAGVHKRGACHDLAIVLAAALSSLRQPQTSAIQDGQMARSDHCTCNPGAPHSVCFPTSLRRVSPPSALHAS